MAGGNPSPIRIDFVPRPYRLRALHTARASTPTCRKASYANGPRRSHAARAPVPTYSSLACRPPTSLACSSGPHLVHADLLESLTGFSPCSWHPNPLFAPRTLPPRFSTPSVLAPVPTSLATSHTVRAPVPTSRATSHPIRAPVPASRSTSHAIHAPHEPPTCAPVVESHTTSHAVRAQHTVHTSHP